MRSANLVKKIQKMQKMWSFSAQSEDHNQKKNGRGEQKREREGEIDKENKKHQMDTQKN